MRPIAWALSPEPAKAGNVHVGADRRGVITVTWYCGDVLSLSPVDWAHVVQHIDVMRDLLPDGWMDLGHYRHGLYVHIHEDRLYADARPQVGTGSWAARSVSYNELREAILLAADVQTPETER